MTCALAAAQEVADVDLKHKLTSGAAELSSGVAGLAVDDAAARRPRRTSAYATLKKVPPVAALLLHRQPGPSLAAALFGALQCSRVEG